MNIICSILKEGVEKGVFHINDVPLAAMAIGHALRGFELNCLVQESEEQEVNWLVHEREEQIEHYLDELMNIVFYGLMAELA